MQSSSVVGLMVLAFVGAGILDMRNALGIILGANLGTTFTGWVVATLGFKLNLTSFYLPLVGLACLGLVYFRLESKARYFSRLFLGLGLLLMGLVLIKDSIQTFSNSFDISVFSQYGIVVFFLVGVIFTAIIQSSSATMMITLSALNSNIIGLEASAALVIGADLGTTGTVMLGAVKGSPTKRQVVGAHFLFNLITDLIALLCLPFLLVIVTQVYGLQDPLISLVALHSTFNVIGICVFLPFLNKFAKLLEKIFKEDTSVVSQFIKNIPIQEVEESVVALEKETKYLFHRVFQPNLTCFNISAKDIKKISVLDSTYDNHSHNFEESYEEIKQLEGEIIEFAYNVKKYDVDIVYTVRIDKVLETVRDTAYAAKEIKDIRHDLIYIRQAESHFIYDINKMLGEKTLDFYTRASELFNPHNKIILQENCLQLKQDIELYRDRLTTSIYHRSSKHNLTEQDLSTLLNVIGDFSLSNTLLLRALQGYLLL